MVNPKSEVYTASYSGIQVFEMSIGDCIMMRRRSDSYLNATQILKLVGLDKGKRTKILEREVITKTHEKIQGGYGKYQGTWVPLDIGRELADRYEVLHLLLPLLDFDTSTWNELPEKEQTIPRASRARINHGPSQSQSPLSLTYSSQYDPLTTSSACKRKSLPFENDKIDLLKLEPSPTSVPIPLALPSTAGNLKKRSRIQVPPKQKQHTNDTITINKGKEATKGNSNSNITNFTDSNDPLVSPASSTNISKKEDGTVMDTEQNRNILLSIFSSDDGDTIPSFFYGAGATTGIDFDISIDEQGHTALHWSVSLGRMHTAEWLISKGAKVIMVNSVGETPLMRGVMATYVYDHDCFPHMLDILRDSLSLVDYAGRNILHHIVLLTLESKTTAKISRTGSSAFTSSNTNTPTVPSMAIIPSSSIPVSSPSSIATQPPPTTTLSEHENRLLAAKSYMAQVISVINQHNRHILILNQPDMSGETPYDLAHRLNCLDLCDLLVQSGCSLASQESLSENGAPSFMSLPSPIAERTEQASKRPKKKLERKDKMDSSMDGSAHGTSTKGQELVSIVQQIVDSMDMEFSNKLQEKEADISRLQLEIRDLTQQLDNERTESMKSGTGQLDQAYTKIKHLEDILGKAGINDLEIDGTDVMKKKEIELESTTRDTKRARDGIQQLEEQITLLQSQLTTAIDNSQHSESLTRDHAQTLESLAAYKRLIARCCNLPLEKVDDFIGPLTIAIENDPPDLDFARVIGFMEKLRQHQQ